MSVEDHVVDLGPEDVRPVPSPEPGSLPGKEESAAQSHTGPASTPDKDVARATFFGNTYDLAALGASAVGC